MALSKSKKEQILFLLNTSLFLLGGVDFFNKGNTTLFIILVVTGLINFSMLLLSGESIKSHFNVFLFFLNSVIAFLVARDYYFSGSNYIHFAWIFAGTVYFAATIIVFKRSRK